MRNPQNPEIDPALLPEDGKKTVRSRLAQLRPAANFGHRGKGHSRPGNPHPENSLAAFRQAISEGAHGVELDVELCADSNLVVMHDDTLDRTTNQKGGVSAWTSPDLRTRCRLLDGDGHLSAEPPPTLAEAFEAVGSAAMINIELKVFEMAYQTPSSGPTDLADAAIAEVRRLGVLGRTLFSSFDPAAVRAARAIAPEAYVALLLGVRESVEARTSIGLALELGADAIHPFFAIPDDGIAAARRAGLDVNVWTVNEPEVMRRLINAGATAIITDQPGVLAQVLAADARH